MYLHDIRVYYACMYVTLIVYVWWSCLQFRLIVWRNQSYTILLIYSLEEGRHHLFQTILAKYTNPFWQNDCSSIPNSHYKWHRFKPGVDTTMNRNSNPVWCVHGIYIATCISEYKKVMYSLSCTFKTWMQCVVYIFVGLP